MAKANRILEMLPIRCGPVEAREIMLPPDFCRSVNPNYLNHGAYCAHSITSGPHRFSDLPMALHSLCYYSQVLGKHVNTPIVC
jgi:hypothetical protein